MPNIFISYRREESAYVAAAVAEKLAARYGKGSIFLDIDNIPIGVDFRQHLHAAVSHADIVLVLIGDTWINCTNEDGRRRIDSPMDFVRIEIEAALARNILTVPVLIDQAKMPREEELPDSIRAFSYRNATELRPGKEFLAQLNRLVDSCSDLTWVSPSKITQKMNVPSAAQVPSPPLLVQSRPRKRSLIYRWFVALCWLEKPSGILPNGMRVLFFLGAVCALFFSTTMFLGWIASPNTPVTDDSPRSKNGFQVLVILVLIPWMSLYTWVWLPGKLIEWVSGRSTRNE